VQKRVCKLFNSSHEIIINLIKKMAQAIKVEKSASLVCVEIINNAPLNCTICCKNRVFSLQIKIFNLKLEKNHFNNFKY
jgi:hypothetical protein